MFGLGYGELIVILCIIVLIFGVGKLPEVGSGLVKSVKNFKKAVSEKDEDVKIEKKTDKDKLEG